MANTRGKVTGFLLVMQAIFLVLFGLFVDYDSSARPEQIRDEGAAVDAENTSRPDVLSYYYPSKTIQDMGFVNNYLSYQLNLSWTLAVIAHIAAQSTRKASRCQQNVRRHFTDEYVITIATYETPSTWMQCEQPMKRPVLDENHDRFEPISLDISKIHAQSSQGYDSIATTVNRHQSPIENQWASQSVYRVFQDIHVMIFIGFGFLMAFLKVHGYGSIGFNFLLGCFLIEWATLVNGWFGLINSDDSKIFINILELIKADFALAAVMISFGAVIGKISPIQMLVMAVFEIVFYNLSLWIGESILEVTDVGGSIYIHVFGAYFGLAIARVLYKTNQTTSSKEGSEYHSDIFSMIGTVFLWVFWPSFNAGLLTDDHRHRAVINTILSLAACTVATFAVSAVTSKKNKLEMAHIQNATLAGGVAVGASANLMIHPFGAMLAGTVAGIISVVGFKYIQGQAGRGELALKSEDLMYDGSILVATHQGCRGTFDDSPALQRVFRIHDTCGVHNLHGMPGILGALISAIVCCVASLEVYQDSFEEIFHTRSPAEQGGFQVAGLVATLAIALASGTLTGFLMKLPIWDKLLQEELFNDEAFWEIPDPNEYESLSPSGDKDFPQMDSEEAVSSYSDQKAASKESLQQQTE